jgi:hypothetical protein
MGIISPFSGFISNNWKNDTDLMKMPLEGHETRLAFHLRAKQSYQCAVWPNKNWTNFQKLSPKELLSF